MFIMIGVNLNRCHSDDNDHHCLQIGFQKCGTTFLDNSVYPKNEHINCIQASNYQELERVLIDKLILLDGLEYDPVQFLDDVSTVSEKYFLADD